MARAISCLLLPSLRTLCCGTDYPTFTVTKPTNTMLWKNCAVIPLSSLRTLCCISRNIQCIPVYRYRGYEYFVVARTIPCLPLPSLRTLCYGTDYPVFTVLPSLLMLYCSADYSIITVTEPMNIIL